MSNRIQVILSLEEREAFRQQAEREGMSLSGWLRAAGLERLAAKAQPAIRDAAGLRRFFDGLPDKDSDQSEPSWDEHLRVIEESRARGRPSS